MLNKEHQKAH